MEPLKLHNPSPLSPSAILAHLRQNVRPIRLESPKLRCDTPEPCDSSDTSTHNIKILNNETPTPSNTTPRDMLDFPQEKTPETPKKLLGILKDSKKSIFFQTNEKISSTPIIDKQALEDRLTKLQNNSLPQSPLKSTRRNSVVRVTGSLEGSRPTSKRKNLSVGNSKDFRLSKKGKKVTFSPDTKDHGDFSSEVTPVRARRPIPPLKNFLKEDLELDSSEVFSPKPMFLNSPIPSAVENKIVPVSVKVLERKPHGSPFNINIRPRVLRDPESPRKGSLNLPNVELISAIKDVTPSGRSCTPKQLQRSENRNPLNLNPIIPAQLKATEEASSFFSPRTGSLSARNNFNVNLNNIQTQSMKNSMITDRSGSKETPIATEKLKASDFNFYAEILKKNKLGPIDKLYRHNSLQSDPRIKQFTITKKTPSTKSVFNSAERVGILNALRPRDIKLDP